QRAEAMGARIVGGRFAYPDGARPNTSPHRPAAAQRRMGDPRWDCSPRAQSGARRTLRISVVEPNPSYLQNRQPLSSTPAATAEAAASPAARRAAQREPAVAAFPPGAARSPAQP